MRTSKAESLKNNPPDVDDPTCFEKFLLAEYDYATKGFLASEEIGERRVSFFITISTAVLAALIAVSGKEIPLVDIKVDSTLISGGAVALLLFGITTLMRIIHRNIETDKFKVKLDCIRKYFVSKCGENTIQYLPYGDPFGKTPRHTIEDGFLPLFSLKTGGLVQTVALMNSLIVVVSVISLSSLIPFGGERIVQIFLYGLIGLVIFIVAWASQMIYIRKRYREW